MAKKKLYKYTIRVLDGNGNHEEEIIADTEVVRNGILYFETEDAWGYAIGLTNLIDMRVESVDEDGEPDDESVTKHVESVLPKEHV